MTTTDEHLERDDGSTPGHRSPGPDGTTSGRTGGPPGPARIAALDVLRGIAILGTLATNIWIFTAPGGPGAWLDDWGGATDARTWLNALSNGKFLALLTLLFGVGLELQYRSAVRRGLRWPGRYLLRATVLFVEGFVHYLLVFEFDVLMGYAIASMLVAFLVGRSERVVRAWAGAVGGVYAAGILGLTALLIADPTAGTTGAPADPAAPGTASWPDQVFLRLTEMGLYRVELFLVVPSSVVLFLVGSRLLRAGLFEPTAAGARLRRRLTWTGLGLGLPLNALTTWAGPDWFLVDRYLVPPLVALGVLALGTSLVARSDSRAGGVAAGEDGAGGGNVVRSTDGRWPAPVRSGGLRPRTGPGLLRRGVEGVGRTALSCYVLQNLIASWLCYDWGLGLADGSIGVSVALWAGISALLLVAAPLWLRRWSRGPLELVMHRVTTGTRSR